jgi:riboflavin kinase/FMN adenylyltransferase
MRVVDGLQDFRSLPAGAVVSIGNFDGVHRGHQQILNTTRQLKAIAHAPATVIVTFEPHPLTVLRPQLVPPRLTPPARKRELLEASGVDILVNLPPAREVLDLTAEQFWQILRDEVRPSHLVEGSSFNFGKNRGGTIERLREWTRDSAIELHVADPVTVALLDLAVVSVSSSLIRWLLAGGRVRDAAVCLGRGYELQGDVVAGAGRGREIGVPTANLRCSDQLIPADGVYAGRCAVDGVTYPAALSIGTNPTFGENPRTIEPHLLDFSGDLYGKTLRVELVDWLREQQTYASVEALKSQIVRDISDTRARFRDDPSHPIAVASHSPPDGQSKLAPRS